jgi:hypothetical protein
MQTTEQYIVSLKLQNYPSFLRDFLEGMVLFIKNRGSICIYTYVSVIQPVVLNEFLVYPLTLRKEHKVWVLDKKAKRRAFGPKREEKNEDIENRVLRSFILPIRNY